MKFEEQLLLIPQAADIKESKLMKHAQKAFESPETGITINVKAAKAVISDCARITTLYLPHYVYGKINQPIKHMIGKFTISQIKDLCDRSVLETHTNQLLKLIERDIELLENDTTPKFSQPISDTKSAADDVYGDYDRIDSTKKTVETTAQKLIRVLAPTRP